mgnify:FL=1
MSFIASMPPLSRRAVLVVTGLGAVAGLVEGVSRLSAPASSASAASPGPSALPAASTSSVSSVSSSTQSLRARFHMTPPSGWLCDGQRPLRYDGTTFFYYLHADDNAGAGGWNLATTDDLVTFVDHQQVIESRGNEPVWTGSAVVDEDDTAGLGAGTLVVLATRLPDGQPIRQQQYMYFSRDGESFSLRPDPVIANPDADTAVTAEEVDNAEWFRDPKVTWDPDRSQWICVIGRRKYLSLYVSADLTDWTWASNFDYLRGDVPDLGGMECPDIFRIVADDGSAHWVLGASMDAYDAGLPTGYAYWVGRWDGANFTTDTLMPQWLDRGWDWYSAVTWPSPDDPEGLRYAIAWMNNWRYAARDVPTDASDGYNGQMSVVRRIRLVRQPEGWYSLQSDPVPALRDVMDEPCELSAQRVSGWQTLAWSGRAYKLELDIEWDAATDVGVAVGCSEDDSRYTSIGVTDGTIYVDRGPCDLEWCSFLPYWRAEAPIDPSSRWVHLRVLVDMQSVEVFVDAGHTVLSQQVYFMDGDEGLRLYSYEGEATFSNIVWRATDCD